MTLCKQIDVSTRQTAQLGQIYLPRCIRLSCSNPFECSDTFQERTVEYYYNPPYFLLVAGLFISVTSGAAFEATLKSSVGNWAKSRSTRILATMKGPQLLLPFLGITIGVCLFLASGVQIFGFSAAIAYAIALPLTVLTSLLVWYQLGRILTQIEEGGSEALDLDSLV